MHPEITVAAITLFGVIVTALVSIVTVWMQLKSKKELSEVNDAVNHRHLKAGPEAKKLYDLVWENHLRANELIEWKRTYDGGPLSSGAKVDEYVDSTKDDIEELHREVDAININIKYLLSEKEGTCPCFPEKSD